MHLSTITTSESLDKISYNNSHSIKTKYLSAKERLGVDILDLFFFIMKIYHHSFRSKMDPRSLNPAVIPCMPKNFKVPEGWKVEEVFQFLFLNHLHLPIFRCCTFLVNARAEPDEYTSLLMASKEFTP